MLNPVNIIRTIIKLFSLNNIWPDHPCAGCSYIIYGCLNFPCSEEIREGAKEWDKNRKQIKDI